MYSYLVILVIFSLCITTFSIENNVFAAKDSFSADGVISSLIFGMEQSTDIVNMSSVQKFILSGYWTLVTDKGKLINFTSEFYTGPINGGNNHTHQLGNLRINADSPVLLNPDGSTQIFGILNVGTNGKNAWNDVHTTITISKERTIAMNLDDNDTQSHFMNQPIYGIVKHFKTT